MKILKTVVRIIVLTATLVVSQASIAAITNLTATSDVTHASYSYNFSGAPTFLRIFLDTDRSTSTGYTAQSSMGANFLIENGNLYRYSGSGGTNWGWTSIGAVTMQRSSGTVKFIVPRTSLGSPTALNVVANTSVDGNSAIVFQTMSSPTSTTTTLSPTVAWTRCAVEGGICSFTGTRQVRYGANGIYALKTATSSIGCNNGTFGDPIVGIQKVCDYSSVIQSSPATTTTVPPISVTTTTVRTVPTTTLPPPTGALSQVIYTASSALIANPERGFFWQPWCDSSTLTVSQLQGYRNNDSNTMLRCMWYMKNYKTGPLPQSVLDFFQRQMDTIRAAGVKLVIHFAYTDSEAGDDAAPSVVMGHLNQLAPYLQRNSDVIVSVAGFIGAWGEWGYSQNYGSFNNWTAQDWVNRKALVDKLLSIMPADRTVLIRTPEFKMRMYGSTALSDSEAYSGTPRSRLGHENDCFLANSTDAGTYVNKAIEYPWLAQETKYLPIGGETCAVSFPSTRSDCSTALAEMEMFHWSFIHQGFYAGVLDKWKAQGCFNTIKAKVGYRFVLVNGQYSTTAKVGGSVNMTINLENQGFASPYNQRRVELVLRNTSTGTNYRIPLNADPRRWLPKQPITLSQAVGLPANLPAGNYTLFLNLPDPAPSINTRPEYSIQLANSNVWESSTGFNRLGANLTVSP